MKNKNLLSLVAGCLLFCSFLFTGCQDDYEDRYQGYGMVDRADDNTYRIKMDDYNILYPKESPIPSENLKDSMRLFVEYSIQDVRDSSFDVKILRAQEILTKSVVAYDTTILDSIGSDPIKKLGYWMAHDFLNFEFTYTCGYPVPNVKHMVNLLHHPLTNGTLELEFRHNAFKDRQDQLVPGVVSFPIGQLLENSPKPVKIKVKYYDSVNSSRTIEFTYK